MEKYPIYFFSAKWSQDGVQDPKYSNWFKDLPKGRIWNSTGFSKMYKKEKTEKELNGFLNKWWKKFVENKKATHPIINPEILYLKHELKEYNNWNLTWFQHETFDEGQTDEEVLRSFEDYVDSVECKNHDIEMRHPEEEWFKHGHKCLMGAEDRWRWCGAEPNGDGDDRSPPPCRCKYCKEQGVIRIGH